MAKLHFLMSILITIDIWNVECSSSLRREAFENGNYVVEWAADTEEQTIVFNVTVATTGFVGFGINTLPGMKGADILICGMYFDGRSYFADYHGIGNQAPVLDASQDWNFITATETDGWTNVQFSRQFESCDENDVTVTADTLSIIWSYGETDAIGYHGNHRGDVSNNILDPPPPPVDISGAAIWNISRTIVMPRKDTTYWCTIHRQPTFPSDQFVIAFSMFLASNSSLKHTHHAALIKCEAPEGENPEHVFEPFVGHSGGDCFDPTDNPLPVYHCRRYTYVWAIGGTHCSHGNQYVNNTTVDHLSGFRRKTTYLNVNNEKSLLSERNDGFSPNTGIEITNQPKSEADEVLKSLETYVEVYTINGVTIFPENVAYNMGDGSRPTYWMYEVHYDNPNEVEGLEIEAAIQVYHTSEPRKYEADLLTVLHDLVPSHLIPPNVTNYVTTAHCSGECTAANFPPNGINVFNVLLHSHLAGRALKIRQFRNAKELPWLSYDQNYDFNYQQNRPLRVFATVLPGDQITYECTTDTSGRTGVTLAGFTTLNEMCETNIWYYPKTELSMCGSLYYNFPKLFERFGIEAVDWNSSPTFYTYDPLVTAPAEHSGKLFSEVASSYPWTPESVREVENELRYSKHQILCDRPTQGTIVTYPHVDVPYHPPSN